MSGTLYTSWKDALGGSHMDEPIAVYENGKIYAAADGFLGTVSKGTLIGEYENGIVYTVGMGALSYGNRQDAVAVIEDGKIYSISKNVMGGISKSLSLGECNGGKVYSHSHKIMEGRESLGLYNGDIEGAAAAAAIVLFGLNSGVSAHDSNLGGISKDSRENKKDSTSSTSSGGGCVGYGSIAGLFVIVCIILFLRKYEAYLTIIFLGIIPAIILLISSIVKCIKNKSLKISFSLKKSLIGLGVGFIYVLIVGGFIFSNYSRIQVVDGDLFIVLSIIMFTATFGITCKSNSYKGKRNYKSKEVKKNGKTKPLRDSVAPNKMIYNDRKAKTIVSNGYSDEAKKTIDKEKIEDVFGDIFNELNRSTKEKTEEHRKTEGTDAETPKSRIKSTMRTNSSSAVSSETSSGEWFRSAGDL